MSEVRLPAETRTEFGKGGARRTRRAGKVPAVIYGHGADPRHVALPAREFANAIRHGGANVLLTLDVEGGEQLVIPKSIQRHPIKGYFEHVDLLAVRRGEKVTVDVPVNIVGDVIPGGLLNVENTTISVEADATNLPDHFEVSIEGLAIGSHIMAGRRRAARRLGADHRPRVDGADHRRGPHRRGPRGRGRRGRRGARHRRGRSGDARSGEGEAGSDEAKPAEDSAE